MEEKALKQIFVRSSIKFVGQAIKAHAEKLGIDVYILDENRDFAYLLADLAPQVVVAYYKDIQEDIEDFLGEFSKGSHILKVLVLPTGLKESELAPIYEAFPVKFNEPISPNVFLEELARELESYSKKH